MNGLADKMQNIAKAKSEIAQYETVESNGALPASETGKASRQAANKQVPTDLTAADVNGKDISDAMQKTTLSDTTPVVADEHLDE